MTEFRADSAAVADPLEAAIEAHGRLLYRLAYSVVRNHGTAEDVVQETFVRALRARNALRDVRSARAWLMKIAWNVALDQRRRTRLDPAELAAEAPPERVAAGENAERAAANRELLGIVERLIETLPTKLKDALVLSTVQELTSAEVGEVLGIPEHSVRTRVMRARQLLKEKLAAVINRETVVGNE